MRNRSPILALAVLALAVAGCSSENDDERPAAADDPSTSVGTVDDSEPSDAESTDAEPADDGALADGADVEPGVPAYDEFALSTGGTVRVDLTTPADGWFAHLGDPERGLNIGPEGAWTGLLWHEANGVYQQRCDDQRGADPEVVPMTDSLDPLVDRPWVTVVEEPRADRLGGRAAEHARIELKGCGGNYATPIVTGGVPGSLPGGSTIDIWLVPLPEADTAMIVVDPTGDGSREVRDQWQQVVDSLEITIEP